MLNVAGGIMQHKSTIVPPIPAEIARTARSVFGSTNFYILLGEQISSIVETARMAHLPGAGSSLHVPGMVLPMITFFQFIEGLTDEQAIAALQARADWKYALHIPLRGLLLPQGLLCAFRGWIMVHPESQLEYQSLVEAMLRLNPPARHSAEHYRVLSMMVQICSNNRTERLKLSLVGGIQALAIRFPQVLKQVALPHWYGLYSKLAPMPDPSDLPGTQELRAEKLYRDASYLLGEVEGSGNAALQALPELADLRQVWEWIRAISSEPAPSLVGGSHLPNCDTCISRRKISETNPSYSLNMLQDPNLKS